MTDTPIPALVRRRAERDALLADTRSWARRLDPSLAVRAVVVFGSVARGDFNVWSDVDVLVVADQLPDSWPARLDVVAADRPPRVAPIAWTPDELRAQLGRRNPIAVEAGERGIALVGEEWFDGEMHDTRR